MNIVLYGVPEELARKTADHYRLQRIESADALEESHPTEMQGHLLLVPKMSAPRQLLSLYNAMMRHETAIDAVIVLGSETCAAASTVYYCSPQDKFFTLNGDTEEEEIFDEICHTIDARFGEANQINL